MNAPWYKDAIIYELHVRSFFDANGDGAGDFKGLTSKLDYLQDLGVTCLWLLPFYPSPLVDDGYDIADYTGVNPDFGTLQDVRHLLREAHRRGLQGDHRAGLQPHLGPAPVVPARAPRPQGHPERELLRLERHDRDVQGGAHHLPGRRAVQLDLGRGRRPVLLAPLLRAAAGPQLRQPAGAPRDHQGDGLLVRAGRGRLRLDAVPYLYEREGTNCENLPETHAFLRQLRAHIDRKWDERLLLAEANQWPEDSVAYFGNGDECHMGFHFPLMPRMFMALRTEDRFPIIDILAQTPPIPETSQWALFLRNHDELTLEMVTDEERDYMYRVYASDPVMRLNLGIRRRLAPLIGNDRRRMELLYGLLLSMPGTPVLYYGDEIGMGDNLALGDRDGVRTPMQWNRGRNAGLLHAPNRRRLRLPGDHRSGLPLRERSTWRPSRPTRTPSCGSRSASSRCASSPWSSAAAASSSCTRRTARSWPTCASTRASVSWLSRTCRASCSTRSWTCPPARAWCRWRCSAATSSRRSARPATR